MTATNCPPLPTLPDETRLYYGRLFAGGRQTHALYGLYKSEIDKYKAFLKEKGAKYLRVVKCTNTKNNPFAIICFKWPEA